MNNSFYKLGIVAAVILMTGNHTLAQNNDGTQKQATARKMELSLTEAIRLGLQNNKQLKLSSAKIEEAVANRKDMWNNHLPDAKISGSYLWINNPDITLKVKLGSGSGGPPPKPDYVVYGLANASLPVFSGLRIKYGVESAKFLENAAKLDAENDKEEVIQNTINAYSNLYKSFKTIELVKKNLTQQQDRVTDFTNLEANGVIAHNDVLKAQLQQSTIELSLLDAENNYTITCADMSLMLGLEDGTVLLPDTNTYQAAPDAGSIAQWQTTAIKSRNDVAALSERQKAADASIKSTKGEYYPGVAITGGYVGADIHNLLTINNAVNVGLGVQYNISSIWKTGAKLDVATARLHELQASDAILKEHIDLQVKQAFQNYLLSQRKIDVYAKAVEQSNENYRITKNKHDNNLVTTTELLEADIAQLQAALNFTFAKVDAVLAYNKLQQASGTLLSSYRSNK